jgi:hypothetical protein
MERIIVNNRLFDWPDGCSLTELRALVSLGSKKGVEVTGNLVDAMRLTDEFEEMMSVQVKLELDLEEMKGRTKMKRAEMIRLRS